MERLPSTPAEAKRQGSAWYFTGKPCSQGHIARRKASNASCAKCLSEGRYKGSPETIRKAKQKARLKKRGGCTPEIKARLLADQSGVCAICQASDRTLYVDHCHTNNRIRAAICHNCNSALGHAKDNPETLRRMAAYVEHHQKLVEK